MENNEVKMESGKEPMPVGRWTINRKKCTTCCECVEACMRSLLYYDEDKKVIMIHNENICDQCGDCVSACAYGAIVLT